MFGIRYFKASPTTFVQQYVAGRIPTARLLDEAWRACHEAERETTRGAVLAQVSTQSAQPEDLDGLTDVLGEGQVRLTRRERAHVDAGVVDRVPMLMALRCQD